MRDPAPACPVLANAADDAASRAAPPAFGRLQAPEPQAARTKAILASHPEVRRLIGRNPWTAAIMFGVVAFQVAVAAAFGQLSLAYWPLTLAAAWTIGAFANHSLYVVIHDAAHDLIFRRRNWNKLAALFADLPNVAPGAMGFRIYHLQHHAYLSADNLDTDLPHAWERRLFGSSFMGKAAWLFLFPIVQGLRARGIGGANLRNGWVLANGLTNVVFATAIVFLFGWNALLYLFASFWFSISLHPLGARWIQEHFTLDWDQETTSYYGPLNFFALNIGFHNEHHDFPSVPWNRLPRLKQTAPEFYESLASYSSWAGLLWRFLSDRRYSLACRLARR
jgi:sphingolipid delta-4 desaturase